MEEKKKTNSKFATLKELWKNPKTHSIVVLGLWLVFIGGVILFLNIASLTSNNDNVTKENNLSSNPLEHFKDMQSYEFSYVASDLSLNGVSYEGKYLLYLNNQKYYKNNSLYKLGDKVEETAEPQILKLNNEMIYNLIKDINPITNEEYDSYLVPLVNFINAYDQTSVTDYNLSSYNIIINTYESDSMINKVTIDLTNYYKYKGTNTESYILTINYYNINNISDFTKEYDEMIGVKE